MAIALDTSTTVRTNNNSSQTQSFTCSNTDIDGRLFVWVAVQGTTGLITQFSVTYGGKALTRVTYIDYADTGLAAIALFELINPPAGTANVVTSTNSGNRYFRTWIQSYTGVAEVPTNTTASNTGVYGSATEPTVDITTVVDNSMVVDCATRSIDTATWTVGSGQTSLSGGEYGTGFTSSAFSSYETKATAGTVTMNWTGTAGIGNWGSIAAVLHPAGDRLKITGVSSITFS